MAHHFDVLVYINGLVEDYAVHQSSHNTEGGFNFNAFLTPTREEDVLVYNMHSKNVDIL